ncbi:MAG: peptidoglycan DD-metalloendopeptidase family protein [Luteococcus sp.]|uniref:peptidoglycan DD-metalloendopeptidase family protein n=1 Tax=Luteococcus sp. TaxID=1969402 RepID=UPI002647F615|nr:peptidoglycan DD-metalloendopeptidase family protein [Luteococcus sp.]MDN5562554.1 peptidoglycan DD-metalloendopeptidase family protein [Luteococcus sp.]
MKKILGGSGALVACFLLLAFAVPLMLLMVIMGGDDEDKLVGGVIGGLSDAVPAQYVDAVTKAGSICPEITAPLIAAQIEAESNWNPNAVSPVGAVGIAQFMPSNFSLIQDENGDGKADPRDPLDEIPAQGRLMCSLVPLFSPAASGDELLRLTLAAYNAGPGNVLPAGCAKADKGRCKPSVPGFAETQGYVIRIMGLISKYQGAEVVAGSGAWVQPLTSFAVGGTFRQVGQHWAMCGFHTGYDYAAPQGTPVHAAYEGKVIHAAWGSEPGGKGAAYGNQIIIEHPNGMRSYYDHLSGYAVGKGDAVKTGQLIGQVGQTGNAFGAHLHMELTKSADFSCDNFVDPHAYIAAHRTATAPAGGKAAAGTAGLVIAAAKSQIGVPYSWGGGALDGPSVGATGVRGFDCSSFVRYAWYQGSGKQITIPRTSQEQAARLPSVTTPEPGDLIVYKLNSSEFDHVGLYLGGGQMVHAPNPSKTIEIVNITSGYYQSHHHEYRRPA